MAETLNEKLKRLESNWKRLESKVKDLSRNTEESGIRPYSKVGGIRSRSQIRPVDIFAGLGGTYGGNMIWNDSELILPPYNQQPPTPTKGFNRHTHSRYSGGALDISSLELIEYETNELGEIIDSEGNVVNKHTQQFWKNHPKIVKDGEIEKIGLLDIQFDPTTKKWKAGGGDIDVETTYFVQYIWKKDGNKVPAGTEGATKEIKKDSNDKEMRSPLLHTTGTPVENYNKSNVVWDEINLCWRLYAVFKPYLEPEEE